MSDDDDYRERLMRVNPVVPEQEASVPTRDGEVDTSRRLHLGKLARHGFPKQYCGKDLPFYAHADKRGAEETNRLVRELCAMRGKGMLVLIVGGRGRGKTMTACRLARTLSYSTASYFEGDALHRGRLAAQAAGYADEVIWTDRLRSRVRLLVVDEIQRGFDARDQRRMLANEYLEHVVNGRYDNELDTVLVANWSEDQVELGLPESIADRIRQRQREGRGGLYVCDWPSLREDDDDGC